MFFYEMLVAFNENKKDNFRLLYVEANELSSIIIASINTTLKNIELNKKSKTD
jgi:hypothetical protein